MGIDNNIEEEVFKYWIGSFLKFRAIKIEAMIKYFGNPKEAFYASDKAVEDMIKICSKKGILFDKRDLELIISGRDIEILRKNFEYLISHKIEFVTMLDKLYPSKLRDIYDPPFLLFYKGRLLPEDKKKVSIVGARECSIYGKEIAKYLAAAIAEQGIIIISGLARGIDSCAHMGALSNEGITYGIMGCGIDLCYPIENLNIYMDMQKNGGIISEYGPGIKPLAYHFPMRNRIISALSDGILVIEAREKSGSLITVDMGLDQGKNIYAVPGRITDKLSDGCNNLIKMGAKLVTSPKDILEDFMEYYTRDESGQEVLSRVLNKDEQYVYDFLGISPKHTSELTLQTGFDIGKLMEHLLSLELKDMIHQPMKNYYIKKRVV